METYLLLDLIRIIHAYTNNKYHPTTPENLRYCQRELGWQPNNHTLQEASQNGHTEVVRLLLADHRVDPSADNNYAIQVASYKGLTEVVRLLLADHRVDPSANNNRAIQWASSKGHNEVVRLLLADQRVNPASEGNWAIL